MKRLTAPSSGAESDGLPGETNVPPDEWMAPAEVVDQVKAHYRETVQWLEAAPVYIGFSRWRDQAPRFLSGACLVHFTASLQTARESTPGLFDVLRAEHHLSVRYFSHHGVMCLLTDEQRDRRIATYSIATGDRLSTQDMGSSRVVFAMRYVSQGDARWKVDTYLQEMPLPAPLRLHGARVIERAVLPRPTGRDS
jgi:hypothetical protein